MGFDFLKCSAVRIVSEIYFFEKVFFFFFKFTMFFFLGGFLCSAGGGLQLHPQLIVHAWLRPRSEAVGPDQNSTTYEGQCTFRVCDVLLV